MQFVDNETVECKVQGTDASDDLAVVKVALSDIKDSTLKEIKVATVNEDTDTLEVGQGVIAIGNARLRTVRYQRYYQCVRKNRYRAG